jgi:membrane-associated PAP2 superfamily phosphatase
LGEEDGAITTPIKPIRILRMPPTTGHLAHSSEHPATTALLAPAAALLLGIAVLITVIGQYTDLDLILADLYFDQNKKVFPWNTTWFARDFMHGWVKNVLRWVGFAILALTFLDLLRPLEKLSALRRTQLRVLAIASLAEPFIVSFLKERSNMHCPWDVDRFGGSNPFLRLLDWIPDGWHAGHCFPAGHASTAMWLCALAVFWLPHSPRKAALAFVGGSGLGFVLGWVQQMRGQHFLTHTLWTTWISAALLLLLIALFSRQLLVQRHTAIHQRLQPATCTP